MRLEAKAQIARGTLSLLVVVVTLFLLGGLVLVLCVGFNLNPFRETTTSFLVAAFLGLLGAAVVLVLLNVATNMSLLAEAKVAELKIETGRGVSRKWLVAFGLTAAILVGLVFGGTYLSKERFLGIVRKQADDVLKANQTLLEEVSQRLASGKLDDYKRIAEIRQFLQEQRSGLPQLTVIYAVKFADKLALYQANENFQNYAGNYVGIYTPTYFTCTENLDCEYLTRFFSGANGEVLQKHTIRDDQFYIYIPIAGKEARFVLLFDRRNSYGKLGS